MSEIAFSSARRLGPQKSAKFFILLGFLGNRLDHHFRSAGADSRAWWTNFRCLLPNATKLRVRGTVSY